MYRDIPEEMRTLIEPIVQDHGLELLDVVRQQGHVPWRLRVLIDSPQGDGMIPVDSCAAVSREIAANLDASDAIPVAYHLEVSSPGLDRALTREKDFAAACGSEVKLETRTPIGGRRRFRGELVCFADGTATVAVDGAQIAVPFAEITGARIIYEFTRADFAGTSGK